ncbi:Hypothetical predicted protein [Mytilus galloprovincialis]|uniref:DUF5641 domain-containing protein n=1 Tax=Mytilus galloprovincialis TaxID=29158 RepID=A0A8B6DDR5_MYTGA|nr:Hypothetical predicted protein [Mytilus galloprovincialis]
MTSTNNWDEPLPELMRDKWEHWKDSLQGLHHLSIPRSYATFSWKDMSQREVYVYCDASEKAIAVVAFLKAADLEGNNHISILLNRHYHSEVKHQGRHFTAGALRYAGFWIVGEKRLISPLLHKCVICRKLRGKQEQQLMSDLPADRLSPIPPFSSVGIDTFGPWSIVTRKTRGGQANSKRWALLFTCLSTRAIHIKVIEELSYSLTLFVDSLPYAEVFRKFAQTDEPILVWAVVNGRPIVPVSSEILSPAMLLIQKAGCYPAPIGTFDTMDLYKAQWKRVQYLADIFWHRWNKKYLQTLQTRRKWTDSSPNVKQGDIVLIKDKNVSKNEWPTGIIVNPLPGHDERVRNAEVRVARNGSTYTRPISEMVLLVRV